MNDERWAHNVRGFRVKKFKAQKHRLNSKYTQWGAFSMSRNGIDKILRTPTTISVSVSIGSFGMFDVCVFSTHWCGATKQNIQTTTHAHSRFVFCQRSILLAEREHISPRQSPVTILWMMFSIANGHFETICDRRHSSAHTHTRRQRELWINVIWRESQMNVLSCGPCSFHVSLMLALCSLFALSRAQGK